ncbi:MAG TPA: hypothetical protein DD417_08175 [Elusimicrobia bacterium]|nr:hypothetical protein [Elusimicrobiota bacterium]
MCRQLRLEPIAVIIESSEVTRLMDPLGLDVGFPKTLPARSPPEAEEGTESPDEDSQLDRRLSPEPDHRAPPPDQIPSDPRLRPANSAFPTVS